MKRHHTLSRMATVAALIAFFIAAAQTASAQGSPSSYEDIWATLGGPALQGFLQAGLSGSPALAESEARVRLAAAAAREAGAERLPSVSARMSGTNARAVGRRASDADIRQRSDSSTWGVGLDLQHTFDVWGRAAASAHSAGAEADAARLDRDGARAGLARDIVQAFADVAVADARQVTLGESIDAARDTLRLTRVRFANGVASTLDVEAATAELERLLMAQAELVRSRTAARARLAALVGDEPFAVPSDEHFADALAHAVPVPPPANVRDFHSRPDLRAIELRAAAAGLRVTAAQAALYPDLTLSAGLSTTGRVLVDAFDPRYLAASLVAGLAGPVFDGGRRRSRLAAAHAEAERIAAEQRGALLRAAQEVIDAQSTLSAILEQTAAASRRVTAQRRVVLLLETKRAAGAASLLDVLRERGALIGATEEVSRLAAEQLSTVARLLVATGSAPPQLHR